MQYRAPSHAAERIVVAAAADDTYALPLAVMLRSAAGNLAEGSSVDAYVASDGLSSQTLDRVESAIPPTMRVHWVPRTTEEFAGFPCWGRMSLGTYHKTTLGSWLPSDVGRAIWLDCDTLVSGDLAVLWRTPMGDRTVLACRDPLIPRLGSTFGVAGWQDLGLPPDAPYFNAGVMLIDVDRWRELETERRSFDYLHRFGRWVWFWDQEALNATLAGEWGFLDDGWNWPPDRRSPPELASEPDGFPWIVHFSGNLKPWRVPGLGRFFTEYDRWLARTAWAGMRRAPSAADRMLAAYARSPARSLLRPIERLHMRWVRWSTKRMKPTAATPS